MSEKNDKLFEITRQGDNLIIDGIGTFTPFDRSLYLRVQELHVSEHMRSSHDDDSKELPFLSVTLGGLANLERHIGFEVIGHDHTLSKSVRLEIHSIDDNDLEKLYIAHQQALKNEADKEKKLFDFSGTEKFYTHTSFSFFPGNWEFDTDDEFIISLYFPSVIFKRILNGIHDKSMDALRIGLEFKGLYQLGEPSYIDRPIKIYFEPSDKEPSLSSMQNLRSPKAVEGYISSLGIGGASRVLTTQDIGRDLVDTGEELKPNPTLADHVAILNKTMKSIKTALWVFLAFLIIILTLSS